MSSNKRKRSGCGKTVVDDDYKPPGTRSRSHPGQHPPHSDCKSMFYLAMVIAFLLLIFLIIFLLRCIPITIAIIAVAMD